MTTQKETAKLRKSMRKTRADIKDAQKFVGGYVEGMSFLNGDYLDHQ